MLNPLTFIKAANKFRSRAFARFLYSCTNRLWNSSSSLPESAEAACILEDFSPDKGMSSLSEAKPLAHIRRDLTIIVAAYNVEDYIEECLDSLLSQTTDYDFIVRVVNDASTDATESILQKFASDPRLEIINHTHNQGQSAARNSALENIDSRFIACVDADDKLVDGAIQRVLDKAYATGADIVEVAVDRFSEDGKIVYRLTPTDNDNTNRADVVSIPTVFIYKSQLFERVIFPLNYWYEDIIFEGLIFPQVSKIASLGSDYYLYRMRPGSITESLVNPRQLDSLYSGINVINDSVKMGLWSTDANRKYLTDLLCHIIRITYVRTCRFDSAIRKSVFVRWADFLKSLPIELSTDNPCNAALISSIRECRYRAYERTCILDFYLPI